MAGFARHGAIAALGTVCSRLLGFVRDMALAWLLGAGPLADAVTTALRLPFAVRRLFGEGVLSQELTTRFVEARHYKEGNDAVLARILLWCALCAGLLVFVPCLLFPAACVRVLAPGFGADPAMLAQAGALLRVCAGYIPAVFCAAVCMAFLHARERFGVPALTGSVFNGIVIAFCAGAACGVGEPGLLIAWGVCVGGFAQWWVQMPAVRSLAKPLFCAPKHTVAHVERRQWAELARLPVGILCAALPQMAFLIAAAIASFQGQGALSPLFYAERLLEFPLGLIGSALGMAAAPRLAKAALMEREGQGAQVEGMAASLHRIVALGVLVSVPAAVGLVALAVPLVDALFGRGAFDERAVELTALCIAAYAPCLPAYVASRPLLSACHATHTRRVPLYALGCGLGLSVVCGVAFAAPLGVAGPPLGASFGLWGYAAVLWYGVGEKASFPCEAVAWALAGSFVVYCVARMLAGLAVSSVAAVALAVPGGMTAYVAVVLGSGKGRRFVTRLLSV